MYIKLLSAFEKNIVRIFEIFQSTILKMFNVFRKILSSCSKNVDIEFKIVHQEFAKCSMGMEKMLAMY